MAGPLVLRVTSADVSRMLLESDVDSGSINVNESSDSDVDCVQE